MTLPADYQVLARSFARDLKLEGRKEKTISMYGTAVTDFGGYLAALPAEAETDEAGAIVTPAAVNRTEDVTKDHIRSYIGHLRTRGSRYTDDRAGRPLTDAYINNIYRSLQAFWKWMVTEEYLGVSPMATLAPPKVAVAPVPVIGEDVHRALLETCGKGRRRPYADVRDEAVLRVLGDTGARVSEVVVGLADLHLQHNLMRVTGKNDKQRDLTFGDRTAKALDGYLYARAGHKHAKKSALWLGPKGPMTASGIYQIVVRRSGMIGVKIHPHQFRHSLAHEFRKAGGSETGLMRIMGWDSPTMAQRYGASAADERAREEHTRLALGDRF